MAIEVNVVVTGPFVENSYVVMDAGSKDAVVIDPGDDAGRILRTIEQLGARPLAVLLTHAHIDHAGAVGRILAKHPVPFVCHRDEQEGLEHLDAQGAMFGLRTDPAPKPTRFVEGGETLEFGSLKFQVLFTPGHTAGGVSYVIDKYVFVGDTLFAGSIGRTDLPGGSYDAIIDSIENRIMPLGDRMIVCSGHGPETTVAVEKRTNPFLR